MNKAGLYNKKKYRVVGLLLYIISAPQYKEKIHG